MSRAITNSQYRTIHVCNIINQLGTTKKQIQKSEIRIPNLWWPLLSSDQRYKQPHWIQVSTIDPQKKKKKKKKEEEEEEEEVQVGTLFSTLLERKKRLDIIK